MESFFWPIFCEGSIPQPKILSPSPNGVPGDEESVLLTVNGSSFVADSQIMWNGNALPTTFMDSDQERAGDLRKQSGARGQNERMSGDDGCFRADLALCLKRKTSIWIHASRNAQ